MRLTSKEIQEICVGAVRVTEECDGLHFYKCTERQMDIWKKESVFLYNGSCATTGIRLDFHTNSKNLTFSLSQGNQAELFLDGQFRYQWNVEEYRNKQEPIHVCLNDSLQKCKDDLRVTLFFPSHSVGVLDWLELDDGSTVKKHRFDCNMLFIGDSITQGYNSELDSFSWANRVSRFFNANSVIQGIGGAYYQKDSFERLSFEPDIIIVAYGTNDLSHHSLDVAHEHMSAYLDSLVQNYKEKKVFVISPIWRYSHSDGRPMEESFRVYRALIEAEVQKRKELILIPGLEIFPPVSMFYADTCLLHPNMLAFGVYAENVIRMMQPHLV